MDVKVNNGKFVDIDLPSLLLLAKKVAIEGVPQGFFLLMLLVDSVHTKTSNLVKLNYHSTACTWTVETGKSHSNIKLVRENPIVVSNVAIAIDYEEPF